MRAPTFTFFHDLSAVYTGAFKASPSAKQALSPKDNPSGLVRATRSPTSLAGSEVKGTASRMGLSAASHAPLVEGPAFWCESAGARSEKIKCHASSFGVELRNHAAQSFS